MHRNHKPYQITFTFTFSLIYKTCSPWIHTWLSSIMYLALQVSDMATPPLCRWHPALSLHQLQWMPQDVCAKTPKLHKYLSWDLISASFFSNCTCANMSVMIHCVLQGLFTLDVCSHLTYRCPEMHVVTRWNWVQRCIQCWTKSLFVIALVPNRSHVVCLEDTNLSANNCQLFSKW